MKWIVSRYNHEISYLKDYTDDVVLYDRSQVPMPGSIVVPNVGSDIYDKLTYIIDNYDHLPDAAVYTKANLFDYIRPKEFNLIKNNTTFTPILSYWHKEVMCDTGLCKQFGVESKPFSFYKDEMYYELNYPSYLKSQPAKDQPDPLTLNWYLDLELVKFLKMDKLEYIPFAPGSNYIIPKENILKHSKEFYQKLKSYLEWAVYPGEAMIIERGLYTLLN